ncbi:FISUMP domain-containing protein [Elizabethkingia anophelis]|uniref:FISUMP domain-containing protein n=1 Tax=Elizabethkingia anophelis TaxID=1117645 RepID=UPI0038917468
MKRNINKNIKHISFSIAMLSNLFYISSCRSAEHDNIVAGGAIAAVKINLLGSDYASGKSSNQANLKETGLPVKDNVQRQSKMITPSLFFEAELAPSNNDANKSGRASTEPTALIAGDQIGAGMKFRIIAYRQDDNSYQAYQDYTVGEQAQPLMLDSGKAYTIIAYSYGSTSALPEISTGEMTNLSQAKIGYDDNNKDLMYHKTEGFIPDGNNPNNKVDIKLRHKLNQITTVINSYIGDISEISWADLRPHHPQGVLSLSNGAISRTYESAERLKFSGTFPTTTATADPVLINADTNGSLTGLFSANLTVSGTGNKTIDLPNTFKITPEYKSTLTINLKKCGAYLGPNNTQWKEFMCQNLGATEGINPFSPEAGNHGAKYQWGYKPINVNSSDDRYYTQADDQSNSGLISGWNSTPKPNGSWSDASKTANDPCPSGYRVPTQAQWQAVISNNNVERVGTWVNDGNYTTALYFRNPSNVRTLMLPAAGSRYGTDGTLGSRGDYGSYWSSSEATSTASILYFYSSSVVVSYSNRSYGFSVRCVAE